MEQVYNQNAPKKATNLSVNSDLLQQAKGLGINLSQVFEDRLAEIVKEHRRQQWLRQHGKDLEGYGEFLERGGLFSDAVRRF